MESQYHAAGIEGILVSFSPSHKSHACRQKNLHESIPCFLHPSKVCIMDGEEQ